MGEELNRIRELERALSSARTTVIGLATPLVGSMSPEIAAKLDAWALLLKGSEPRLPIMIFTGDHGDD